jgi:hypothetical protein
MDLFIYRTLSRSAVASNKNRSVKSVKSVKSVDLDPDPVNPYLDPDLDPYYLSRLRNLRKKVNISSFLMVSQEFDNNLFSMTTKMSG